MLLLILNMFTLTLVKVTIFVQKQAIHLALLEQIFSIIFDETNVIRYCVSHIDKDFRFLKVDSLDWLILFLDSLCHRI